MNKITILEQGIWPDDKPIGNPEWVLSIDQDGDWTAFKSAVLNDGDAWLVLSKPEKALEDMTIEELTKKWVDTYAPHRSFINFEVGKETPEECLIRNLK